MNTTAEDELKLFVDTSILIAYHLRAGKKREQIKSQLDGKKIISCSVTLNEYKRRVLGDAAYIITLFHKLDTVEEVLDHITNNLQTWHPRKQTISLNLFREVLLNFPPEEHKERALRYFHQLIKRGSRGPLKIIDDVYDAVGCACAKYEIEIKKPYKKYRLVKNCNKVKDECGIISFMKQNKATIKSLLNFLADRTGKFTDEMKEIYTFIQETDDNYEIAPTFNPCLTVGDLLIALESKDIKTFYTMNKKESKFFCDFLKQDLIVSSSNQAYDDKTYTQADLPWDELYK